MKIKARNKLVYGVGVNDYIGLTKINNKAIKEYVLWKSMLRRCYDEKHVEKQPTYMNCYVDEFLLSFNNFYNHIHTMKGFNEVDNNGANFQLDKDILYKGNKVYHKDKICFVPKEINTFFVNNKASRGENLIGVRYHKRDKIFDSKVAIDGKPKHLGSFKTELEAFNVYKEAKEQQAKVLAERWKDKIDERAYNALMNYKVEITD